MARKTGAPESEGNKDQKPTEEAPEEVEKNENPESPDETRTNQLADKALAASTEGHMKIEPAPVGHGKDTLGEVDKKVHVKKKKMFRIILDEQDNSDKNNDQLITDPSDGKQYLIKRGFKVDVPEGVVNNLKESVIERLEYDENGEEVWRNIPRFAMRVIKELN